MTHTFGLFDFEAVFMFNVIFILEILSSYSSFLPRLHREQLLSVYQNLSVCLCCHFDLASDWVNSLYIR